MLDDVRNNVCIAEIHPVIRHYKQRIAYLICQADQSFVYFGYKYSDIIDYEAGGTHTAQVTKQPALLFNIMKTKKAIKKAFTYQMQGKGFCLIEVLSTCPTNWGLSPIEAMKWLEENMIPYYPLGVKKDKEAE